jgi:hypothetical protein
MKGEIDEIERGIRAIRAGDRNVSKGLGADS